MSSLQDTQLSVLPSKVKKLRSPELIKLKIVPQLVAQLKLMLKDIDLNLIKTDPVIVEFILSKIKETAEYLVKATIEKEELIPICIQVIKGIIPSITPQELEVIEKIIQFIEKNHLAKIKKRKIYLRWFGIASKFLSKIL